MKQSACFLLNPTFLLTLLSFAALPTGYAAINFVQLTDPHLFERADRDRIGQDTTNRIAFADCITRVNLLNNQLLSTKGAGFNFVVVTGDIGIEQLNPLTNAANWTSSVELVADLIHPSEITNWYFIPGNNDLDQEKPDTIWKYHQFIAELKTILLTNGIQVADLCPPGTSASNSISGEFSIGKFHFLGFDNASFKSNYEGKDAQKFHSNHLDRIQQIAMKLTNEFIYIFYHIPEIDDPNALTLTGTNLTNRIGAKRIAGDPEYFSSWTVSNDVRIAWDEVVTNSNVKALIAGHFHSDILNHYSKFDWLTNTYASRGANKLFISPPVACKFQDKKTLQARGFRTYSIADNGDVTSEITWYGFPPPTVKNVTDQAPSYWKTMAKVAVALLVNSFVLALLAKSFSGGKLDSGEFNWFIIFLVVAMVVSILVLCVVLSFWI
jgi:3',5'-cyclic AMP phosphodiesterase CpdA